MDSSPRDLAPSPGRPPLRQQHLPNGTSEALRLLGDAYQYALQLRCDIWEFALELKVLRESDCSHSDIRWLLCKGFTVHGRETSEWGDPVRSFERGGKLSFFANSCFVLTTKGYRVAVDESLLYSEAGRPRMANRHQLSGVVAKPRWDRDRHEFRLGLQLIKQYRLPSPNQERVLTAFEEEGWPQRIDDPLPPCAEMDPKRRLHDTIKSLNRNQKLPLVRFHGDGTGQGVRWGFPEMTLPHDVQADFSSI